MKNSRTLLAFIIISFIWSCDVIYPDFGAFVPEGDISALVIRTQLISSNATEIVYDTELQFIEKYFNADNSSVIKSDFKVDERTTIMDVDPISYSGTKQSDVILLIDQSKSYEESDPYNARAQVISKFADEFDGQDLAVAGFAKSGQLDEPLEFINPDGNRDLFIKSITDLAKRTGGVNNLYDALDLAISSFSANSMRQKNIVALLQSNDAGSAKTLQAIIDKADLQNVRIHIIALGSAISHLEFAQLSQQTDGFYSACVTDKQMIQALDNLNRNITGYSAGVKVRVKVIPEGGVVPGVSFLHPLIVEDYIYQYNYNTVYPFLKLP
jgi:hypothetical protein